MLIASDGSAIELLDEVFATLAQPQNKQRLQTLLDQAYGDVALICQYYVPQVISLIALVVTKYGFAESLEGVKASIRVFQQLARTDDEANEPDDALGPKLIRLRKAITPTGAWIREDAAADAEDQQKIREEEAQRQRALEETQRMERLAAENAKKARLRAKKLALGLDPSVPRLPLLEDAPPRAIAAHANTRIRLRVAARFTLRYQWFFNGREVSSEDEAVEGVRTHTLVLKRLTRRVVGDYYCVCENEEGQVSTPTTHVSLVALTSSHVEMTKTFKALPSGEPMVCCGKNIIAMAVNNALVLLDRTTLSAVQTIPPLKLTDVKAVAWSSTTKVLAVATSTNTNSIVASSVTFYSLNEEDAASAVPVAFPPSPTRKLSMKSTANTAKRVLTRCLAVNRLVTLHGAVECMQFVDAGRALVLADRRNTLAFYTLAPAFTSQKVISYARQNRISHVTATRSCVAVCCREQFFVEIYDSHQLENPPRRLEFKFPVHRTAFDTLGFSLAVAEAGCMKAWISIVDPRSTSSSSTVRFVAHVGKVSALQWTSASSQLLSCGFDGYVKIWDVEILVCVFRVHFDLHGLYSGILLPPLVESESTESSLLLTLGFSQCRLHARHVQQLNAFEDTRRRQHDRLAAQIQKLWKGRQTRALIAKYIKKSS
ncbi:hypothetical protein Poli38472_007414 [Pythium oligandrum]|uniref:Protein C10 n=1 Tax=Pythium oligandrum TaxID=41045 RepID=A0A8K1FQA5_PYTOL|nr:hypothetical protein Poli38472_007414 [Pythium oligandrum]|eukprot:TMW67742.1 hypothetical protein Poli38472_007414 [Pythium oligandrum]